MPIQAKQFTGVLNLDDQPDTLGPGQHMDALNIVFRGAGNSWRAQNIPGNQIIVNPALPIGINQCIGAWYDQVKGRLYSFLYNSNSNHGIYIYSPSSGTFQTVIQSNTNTNGDVLKFTLQNPILNVNVIYGDEDQGDVLYWINSQNLPCKINVDRALASGYGVVEESFLDVAKEIPSDAPQVVYEDDTTVTVNNLRKRLFKFKTRYVFDDDEKSCTSIQSEIPLPDDSFETSVDTNPTKNARIAIVYQTGAANVKKIELLGAVSTGNEFSDFFLIESIDKDLNSLSDNDVAVYYFYNNQAYNNIDLEESIQLFDYVPLQAVAQETLNGNVLIYGNITEGYPNLTRFRPQGIGPESYILFNSTPHYEGTYFTLFSVTQSGQKSFGTGRVHVILKGNGYAPETVTTGNHYFIRFTDGTVIEYTAVGGDTIISVLQALINDAIANGFTVTGTTSTPDEIYFSKTGSVLSISIFTPQAITENIESATDGSLNAYDWWSRYSFGLVYFDSKGRTNGVVYPLSGSFAGQTPEYQDFLTTSNVPLMESFIRHIPPEWASYYSWVRTKNLTKSFILQWISNVTFKDTTTIPNEKQYAYISIENLNLFKAKNPNSPLSYDFKPNDRIRFIKRMNPDSSTANIYTNKDFEIQAQEINPTINGVAQTGQFIKIFLPDTDVTFDFGAVAYANYFIELYTPAQPVASGLDVYYEFGERFRVGSPGESDRFHTAELEQQSTSPFVSDAYSVFVKGDNYSRQRTVPVGTEIKYSIPATGCGDADAGRITIGAVFVSRTLPDSNLVVGNSPCNNLIGFNLATNTDRQILSVVTGTYNLRIRGSITINFTDNRNNDVYEIFLQKNTGVKIQLVAPFDSSVAGPRTFGFDVTFQMFTGERLFFFGWSVPDFDHSRTFVASTFSIENVAAIQQVMIDPNFSDYYESAVNSNGRAFVYNENSDTINYPVMMRWGLDYEANTNRNRTNRFYAQNMTEVDRSRGSIQRFKSRDRIMRIFQQRACAQVGVFQKYMEEKAGSQQLLTTDEIITKDNVNYYSGEYGVGNHPESLVSGTIQDYFVDPIRGYQIRLSADGITPISELFKGQFYIRGLLTPYNKVWGRPNGDNAKILGAYDYLNEEYVCVLQAGENSEGFIPAYTFSFNEMRTAYSSFFSYHPEWIASAEDVLYSWEGGQLYAHNSQTYNEFYAIQYPSSITVPFNDSLIQKKTYISISEVSNGIWECPIINSNMIGSGQIQETNLKPADFRILEEMPSASFKRDIHSIGGKINGKPMKGNWLTIKFERSGSDTTKLVYLSAVSLKWIDSPLTNR